MRAVSEEFRRTMAERRNFVNYADLVLSNGTTLHLEPKDFRLSGNTIHDDIVDGNNFSVGTAIGNTVTIVLDNTDERFTLINFYGAYFRLYVALPLPTEQLPNRVEKVKIGEFTVISPATTGTLISIEGVDNMYKFDKAINDSSVKFPLVFPTTLGKIVQNACNNCGVSTTPSCTYFDNASLKVSVRPDGDFTFRRLLSYVCQIACCYAKIDADGRLIFKWMEDIIPDSTVDGGNFRPIYDDDGKYATGEPDADGGNFIDYSSGDSFDGGSFIESYTIHNLEGAKGVKVGTDDIIITGVHVKNGNTSSDQEVDKHVVAPKFNQSNSYKVNDVVSVWSSSDEYSLYKFIEPHTAGTAWDADEVEQISEYEIAISDNPFTAGNEQRIADIIATKLIGFRFRTFSMSHLQDPSIEAGDWVYVTDIKHNTYTTFVTNVQFSTMGFMSLQCNAQPPAQTASVYMSEAASALIQQNRLTMKKMGGVERAMQEMNKAGALAAGMYTYEKINDDGTKIYYISNKPIVDEDGRPRFTEHSKVWKMSGDGFFLCTDAALYDTDEPGTGCQWVNGITSDGEVAMNIISTIGIRWDWAYGGELTLGGDDYDGDGKDDSGELYILDQNGYVCVYGNHEGIKIGQLGYQVEEDGRLIKKFDEVGSRVFLDTHGQIQYYYNGDYCGKIRMTVHNDGSSEQPDLRDYLSFEDFDYIRVGDWNTKHVGVLSGQDSEEGLIDSRIYVSNNGEDLNTYGGFDDYEDYGCIHLEANGGGVSLYSASNIYVSGDGHTYLATRICPSMQRVGEDDKPIPTIDQSLAYVGGNGNMYACEFVNGMMVSHTQQGQPSFGSMWHTWSSGQEGVVNVAIILGEGVTSVVFPETNSSLAYEPFIQSADGTEPPLLQGISFSGGSCTVRFTEVTAAQAAGGACVIKLRKFL